MRKTQDRALQYRRTKSKPGLGICRCSVCTAAEIELRRNPESGARIGSQVEGCEYVNPERAFAEVWEEECKPRPGINYGYGQVQDLMVVDLPGKKSGGVMSRYASMRMAFWLTPRERVICATVVQWLGTNCGMGFLHMALRRCGRHIVDLDARPPLPGEVQHLTHEVENLRRRLAEMEGRERAAWTALQTEKDARRNEAVSESRLFQEVNLTLFRRGTKERVKTVEQVQEAWKILCEDLAQARAVLARLNLNPPAPPDSPVPLARFAGLDTEGGI